MKRSEMVTNIKDALYCHVPFSTDEQLMKIAEAVMQTIEGGNSTGDAMLPPSTLLKPMNVTDNAWDPE